MIYPKFIQRGDTIGVTATSKGNSDELHIKKLENGIIQLRNRGYHIKETPDVRNDKCGRSAPKKERANEFIELISDDTVSAIITARGGEFLLEILPYIDFDIIKQNPKWVQGYSDTTGLGFCITTISDVATIYGENFGAFGMKPWHISIEENLELLEGKKIVQKSFDKYQDEWQEEVTGLEPFKLTKQVKWKNARDEKEIILNR